MPELHYFEYEIFKAYCKISQGVERVTLKDVLAYAELYKTDFLPHELNAIMELDSVRHEVWRMKSQS